jgi:ribosomal-protein-serine acetyltransferase
MVNCYKINSTDENDICLPSWFFIKQSKWRNTGMCMVTIRPVVDNDAQPVYEAIRESLAEVSPWIISLQSSLTLADVQGWIANSEENRAAGTGFNFAIVRQGDNIFLGGCNLWIINHNDRIANLSYWVRTSQAGQGLATQAVRQAAVFAFQQADLLRVEIVVAEPNLASQRVAEKSGAAREGLLRNRITIHGKTYNAWMFSLIPSDFKENP